MASVNQNLIFVQFIFNIREFFKPGYSKYGLLTSLIQVLIVVVKQMEWSRTEYFTGGPGMLNFRSAMPPEVNFIFHA